VPCHRSACRERFGPDARTVEVVDRRIFYFCHRFIGSADPVSLAMLGIAP
jgi:hypothetical protein